MKATFESSGDADLGGQESGGVVGGTNTNGRSCIVVCSDCNDGDRTVWCSALLLDARFGVQFFLTLLT